MVKTICIISFSKISSDSRVLRQIQYLSKKYHIDVIGFGECPREYIHTKNIIWHQIHQPKGKLARICFTVLNRFIRIPFFPKTYPAYKIALACNCDMYYLNNWDALPFGALAARENKSKVALDIHESYKSWYWGISVGVVKYVLKKYSADVGFSTTVVKALAEQHSQFGFNSTIIRNVPSLPSIEIKCKETDPENINLVYHGIASPTRSTDLLIKTLALCDKRYKLHLIPVNHKSIYVSKLRNLAGRIAPGRVAFYSPFEPQEIVQEISKFDIGFFPLPQKNYNYLIALPNKFFEFIAAGLAVAIGPSPSMAEIVREYHCGKVASSFSPEDLAGLLNGTTPEEWDQMKAASLAASQTLNAEIEMQKLLDLFSDSLN